MGACQPDGVLAEVSARVEAMRLANRRVVPPLLLLGVMERVGSNWVSDMLRPVTDMHNEPFRQQLSAEHPLSPLSPGMVTVQDAERQLGPCGRYWLVTFAAGKYGPVQQVIKETNLFFALPVLLDLFPYARVMVLIRSPLGVASSFARGDLFRRWDYPARYRQMTAMTRRTAYWPWAAIVPDDNPPDMVALARLQVLNSLILAWELHRREMAGGLAVIRYETSVLAPSSAHAVLAGVVPGLPGHGVPAGTPGPDADDTYATSGHKTGLTAYLSRDDAEQVRAATTCALEAGRPTVPGPAWELARDWAGGDHLYTLTPLPTGSGPRPPARAGDRRCPVRWVPGSASVRPLWRNLLVTNDEFAVFLNELAVAGLANVMDGCYLLAVEMPHERGGRLHCDPVSGRWRVSPGFGRHPAYWVTWGGAAAFAARHGARLPARHELVAETSRNIVVTNHGYQTGDTVPVAEPGRDPGQVHHLAGNVQVWCCDGPEGTGPTQHWLYGAAWNTPGTGEEINRDRGRHMSGASRGVGIRLVRDRADQRATSAPRVAAAFREWIRRLGDRSRSLRDLDEELVTLLGAASQADGGLGTHIGPSTRKPGHG